jgi:hypothetical protein
MDGKKGALVEGIVWLCDGGEIETYWDAEQGIKKPVLKLRAFEQRMRQLSLRWPAGEMNRLKIGRRENLLLQRLL